MVGTQGPVTAWQGAAGRGDMSVCGATGVPCALSKVINKIHKGIEINPGASLAHQYFNALSSPVPLKGLIKYARRSSDVCNEGSGRILHASRPQK